MADIPESTKSVPSSDLADILVTIQNAADDWQAQGYPTALAEVRDMANVGRALMAAIADNAGSPPLLGWHPADCPSEIVSDLLNMLDDATRAAPPAMDREAVETFEGLNLHVVARIKHVLQTVANYADAERNGGEFADDLRRDIACMNGDVVADDLAQFTAALSTLSADAIRQGEGELRDALQALENACDDLAANRSRETYRNMIDCDRATPYLHALDDARRDARALLRRYPATPASHASDGGKA